MNNDISLEGTSRHKDSEFPLGKHTLDRGDDIPVHDVKDLLKCIKLWKKESKEDPKLSMPERFQNLSTPALNSSSLLLNDEIKKFNNSIGDALLKLGDYEDKLQEDNLDRINIYNDKPEFDKKKIISDLNYPIDLNYQKFGLDGISFKEDGILSEGSSDTRFGTDESDSGNNSYKTSTFTTENESILGNQIEFKGKKIDPEIIYKKNYIQDNTYSKNGNNVNKYVEYNNPNYENNRFEEIDNVDYRDVEEFNGIIGELINGENYQFTNQTDTNELIKKQLENKDRMTKRQLEQESVLVGDLIIPEREFEEDELENEENPILSMNIRENAIITENDILSYGKSDSHTEYIKNNTIENKTEKIENKVDMIKDVSVNCQIDQILNTKEEVAPEVEKIRGVCYCKSDNSWTAWWTEKGKSRKKAFKLSLYGYEKARKLAIEHRKHIEDLIPELKEKRMKTGKRKIINNNKIITNTNNNNINNTNNNSNYNMNILNNENQINQNKTQNSIEKRGISSNEDGIYRGTRKKIRETLEDQGIYFRDNIWYSTWIDQLGNRIVNSFPVTNELPFLAAKTKAINSCTIINQAVVTGSNTNNYQIQGNYQNSIKGGSNKFKGNNSNYYNNMNFRNYEIIKRRKREMNSSGGSISEGFDHFKNLEKKLEELERGKYNTNYINNIQRQGQMNNQSTIVPQIFVQTPQELKLTSSESNQGQNTEQTRSSPMMSSLHCQIKLDRATIKKIENAINLSILQKTNQEDKENITNNEQIENKEEDNREQGVESIELNSRTTSIRKLYSKEIEDFNSDINSRMDNEDSRPREDRYGEDNRNNKDKDNREQGVESIDKVNKENITIDGEDNNTIPEEKYLENVNALCITQTNSDRRTSINIIPTYIMGPQDTQLLTFVILNS